MQPQPINETIKKMLDEQEKQPTPTPSTPKSPASIKLEHDCEACWDTGYVGWKTPYSYPLFEVKFCDCDLGQATERYWKRRENKLRLDRLAHLFDQAGIPSRFLEHTIDSFIQIAGDDPEKQEAIDACQQMIENGAAIDSRGKPRRGLVLSGPYGVGKTGLLTAVLAYWLDQGAIGLWIEFYDLILEIQSGYSTGQSKERIEAARTAEWILLDDVGDLDRNEETTDRRHILYQLINYRHNHQLPTLITTNLSPRQIAQQFGGRTAERLLESCAIVPMDGANLRFQ